MLDSGIGRGPAATDNRPFSEQLQEHVFDYVSWWCRESRRFINKRVNGWKLLEDLYHNRRDLNSWSGSSRTGFRPRDIQGSGNSEPQKWQSDIVLAPAYIVDSWADRSYQTIFSGPEWLTVLPEQDCAVSTDQSGFPTSYKLQELLLARLCQGQVHVRIYEILQHLALYGSVYAKLFWYSNGRTVSRWDVETLDVIDESARTYDCPVIQLIPLERLLIDWTACHCDVQRHSAVGHIVEKSGEHILEQFDRGVYNVNRDIFIEAICGRQGDMAVKPQ